MRQPSFFALSAISLLSLGVFFGFVESLLANHAMARRMAGCYQIDYSFYEVESLAQGYSLDPRVYDATKNANLFELVIPLTQSNTKTHLQRVLFTLNQDDQLTFVLKHHGETWISEPETSLVQTKPHTWERRNLNPDDGSLRKVTSLDDGPRYECQNHWEKGPQGRQWQCSGWAPIPGRETRDMGRKDYHLLDRTTRIIHADWGFLERQNNRKITWENDAPESLAREEAKIFYLKMPTSTCQQAHQWVQERKHLWQWARQTWSHFLGDKLTFTEKKHSTPRYQAIWGLEVQYLNQGSSKETQLDYQNQLLAILTRYSS